jgi:adenine/guanine phosphoribosyltransferase-like PRPP-binding protein
LITSLGATLVGASFFIELEDLAGRAKMPSCPIHSILKY